MAALARQWLAAADVTVTGDGPVEISPLYALDAEELKTKFQPGTTLAAPVFLAAS